MDQVLLFIKRNLTPFLRMVVAKMNSFASFHATLVDVFGSKFTGNPFFPLADSTTVAPAFYPYYWEILSGTQHELVVDLTL